jgi:hypothetical protein
MAVHSFLIDPLQYLLKNKVIYAVPKNNDAEQMLYLPLRSPLPNDMSSLLESHHGVAEILYYSLSFDGICRCLPKALFELLY